MDPSVSGEKEHESEKEQLEATVVEEGDSIELRLLGMLLQYVECVAMDNLDDAGQLLPEIAELSSPFGSRRGVLRRRTVVLNYQLLLVYLLAPHHILQNPRTKAAQCLPNLQFSSLIKFSHFTTNQAILFPG
ncbi:unnamed protein product [Fraxinus pennsylvanica]|uniref:Uncharacterized protein n=1 Tax=Fraxinus pennsylvanica TaxID=56036 RepID=A0AAD2AA58_9LAMI|nr:unnamed protein product [Fraxinus pennsylvanica]